MFARHPAGLRRAGELGRSAACGGRTDARGRVRDVTKRNGIGLVLVLVGQSFLLLATTVDSRAVTTREPARVSVDSRFSVLAQPDAPLCLSLVEASWARPFWTARVRLTNCGTKAVTGFEVGHSETYEHACCIKSSDGARGQMIRVGGQFEIDAAGGFRNGLRLGKAVGELKSVEFSVESLTFDDGTAWHRSGA